MTATLVSRRAALAGLSGLAAQCALAPMFVTEAAPLAYSLKPVKLAEGVWMIAGAQEAITRSNGGAIANVAILDTSEGAVVVDTGPSKRYGEALAALARKLTGKPVVRAYLTHFHPDHIFGSQAFADGALASTPAVSDGVKKLGDDFAAAMYYITGDWMRGTEVEVPRRLVSAGSEEIGDRKLALLPLGGHTPSDLVVYDERSGILFAGDLVFLDRAPTTPHADPERWRTSLDALAGVPHARLMPGHGPTEAGARGIAQTRNWLAAIEDIIRNAFDRGLDIGEAMSLPLPVWTSSIALARYEFQRSVMHFYPKMEAREWPRVDRKT